MRQLLASVQNGLSNPLFFLSLFFLSLFFLSLFFLSLFFLSFSVLSFFFSSFHISYICTFFFFFLSFVRSFVRLSFFLIHFSFVHQFAQSRVLFVSPYRSSFLRSQCVCWIRNVWVVVDILTLYYLHVIHCRFLRFRFRLVLVACPVGGLVLASR